MRSAGRDPQSPQSGIPAARFQFATTNRRYRLPVMSQHIIPLEGRPIISNSVLPIAKHLYLQEKLVHCRFERLCGHLCWMGQRTFEGRRFPGKKKQVFTVDTANDGVRYKYSDV